MPVIVSPAGAKKPLKQRTESIFRNKLDKAVTAIENDYLASATLSMDDISDKVIKEAERLTGSDCGFASYIDPATGWLIAATRTRDIWDRCRVPDKSTVFKNFTGLWGWVLKNKKPLLTNNAPADRRSGGTPDGHIKIEKLLAAPAVFNRKLTGLLALANPRRSYTARDLAAVEKLARIYAIIVQRKFAEDRLKESEENYRAIINASRDIIYTVNAGGIIAYMSRQAENYGYSPDEIVGRHVLEFAHPEDRDMLARALADALKTGTTAALLSYRIRKKDGSYFYAEQKSGIIMKNGRPHMISCVIRDVTERRQLEARILESESKYRTLFENANAAIFLADTATGKILDANRQAELLTGRTRKELTGMNRLLLHPPEEEEYYQKQFRDHVARRTAKLEAAVVLKKNGDRIPVHINAAVLEIGGEKVMQGIFEDVTELKKAQEELTFKNIILSTQQESSLDGILVVDEKGVILSFNKRFIAMWGIPPDVAASRSDRRALDSVMDKLRDPAAFLQKVNYLYEHPEQKSRDEIALRDGRTFDRYSESMRATDGSYLGRVWFFRDITENRRLEAELIHAKAIEAASRITRPAAHDFNNILAAINGYAALILDTIDDKNRAKPEILQILKAVRRASAVTEKLQTFGSGPDKKTKKIVDK